MIVFLLWALSITILAQPSMLGEDEWISDNWEISKENIYHIPDFIEPYSINEYGTSEYFIDMGFTDANEFRCAVAGSLQVVILSERGEEYSINLPPYRGISLTPEKYLASVFTQDEKVLLINAADNCIDGIDVENTYFFTWCFGLEEFSVGVHPYTLLFCHKDDVLREISPYTARMHGGTPTYNVWSYASAEGMLVVLSIRDRCIEAYSSIGDLLWSLDFPTAACGIVPLSIAQDGSCIAVTRAADGFQVLNTDGDSVGHYLEGYSIFSLVVSPEGNYIAAVAAPSPSDTPELYRFHVPTGDIDKIDLLSEQWFPSVRSITDSGILLCGIKINEPDEYRRFRATAQRLALIDNMSSYLWLSSTGFYNDIQGKNIKACISHPVNAGFVGSVIDCSNGYRVCYFDPVEENIVCATIHQ